MAGGRGTQYVIETHLCNVPEVEAFQPPRVQVRFPPRSIPAMSGRAQTESRVQHMRGSGSINGAAWSHWSLLWAYGNHVTSSA